MNKLDRRQFFQVTAVTTGAAALASSRKAEAHPAPLISTVSLPARTAARVLFPDPLGPIMACISPAFTSRLIPFRIIFPFIPASRFLILSMSEYYQLKL